ncbi:MAG: DMT family transporter [Methanobacteriota archaeon]|nr:MAG: DMT family transporter [Euryarchaeota archaeon]
MLWFVLSLVAAFFDATYFTLIKSYLERVDFYVLGAGVSLFSFFFTIIASAVKGMPVLGSRFYPYLALTSAMEVVAMILYFKGLKSHDISLSMPMLSFTPLFLLFTSFLILREMPTPAGAFGILLIVMGSYVLGLKEVEGDGEDPLLPFKALLRNRGTRYMLIVALFWGVETNFVKIVVLNSDPLFAAASFSLLIGAAFLVISIVRGEDVKAGFAENMGRFALAGAVISLSAVAVNQAFTMEIVPYVISIKRLNILFSVLYGALVFHEINIRDRFTGALIMTAGSMIVLLS